jgi:exodeoxyribonuclease V alpha subunit
MSDLLIEGVIQSVYVNREAFSIGTLQPAGDLPLITYLGKFPSFPGEVLKASGYYQDHQDYGTRFIVSQFSKSLPKHADNITALLGSGMVAGVGKVTAERMVAKYGGRIIDVLEGGSERELKVISGIGRAKAKRIIAGWKEYREQAHVLTFFLNAGFNLRISKMLIDRFQPNPELVLRNDPYRIAWAPGIGWARADHFAEGLGIEKDDPRRVRAAVMYSLLHASHGHTYLPLELLRGNTEGTAGISFDDNEELFLDALASLEEEKQIVVQSEGVYHKDLFFAEKNIALKLVELDNASIPEADVKRMDAWVAQYERRSDTEFSDGQRKGIGLAYHCGVSILTGGPGTGKTKTIQGIIALAEQAKMKYSLAAPTGRAAKRITESTGKPAFTLHRLLEFKPLAAGQTGRGMFVRNSENPLDLEMLIVDEMSMVDTQIMAALADALKPGTHLVLTGDPDQLESVGAGNVLHDIIASNMFHITHLRKIFRQAAASKIITNAQNINTGLMIENGKEDEDFHWIKSPSMPVLRSVIDRLIAKYDVTDMKDIQIVTPFRKRITDFNITTLNEVMQEMMNPRGFTLPIEDCTFRVGDKLIQNKNDYEKAVFNGDIGRLVRVEPGYVGMEGYFVVEIDDREVDYHFREWKQLDLAYAVTAHKSQGGEYPYVIIVLPPDRRGDIMLRRNLFYTATTRAAKHCIVMARPREVELAINTKQSVERFTGLETKLNELKMRQRAEALRSK